MSFLQRGLLLSTVAAVFFVTGNGQFAVSSPFYADDAIRSEGYLPNDLAFRVVPTHKHIPEERIADPVFAHASGNVEENKRHAKETSSGDGSKNWLVQETEEVSQSVPNIFGYPEEQDQVRVRYFNTINPPVQPFQERNMESNLSRFRALMALRGLVSQIGSLLFLLENSPAELPPSMFMLRGLVNFNQEQKPLPGAPLMRPTKDSKDEKSSDISKLEGETPIPEQIPIIYPFGIAPQTPGGMPPRPNPGVVSQYKNSPKSKTGERNSKEVYRNGKIGTPHPNELNPMMFNPEFSNSIPGPGLPRSSFNPGRSGGRSRIDNNLRQVPDVPYDGFFPDYNRGDPYSGALHSGYYPPDDPMQYGRPKDHHKNAWKREQEKLLKDNLYRGDFYEEVPRKSHSRKHSKKRRNEMKREEMDDYMFWPPPPSYLV